MGNQRKAQIWVETVIYTLIGLSIITALLAIVVPIINERQDQTRIEQSVGLLNNLNNQIEDVRFYGAGNARIIFIEIGKGEINFNPEHDYIQFFMETNYKYSEPGEDVNIGTVLARTIETPEGYEVTLTLDYEGSLDLKWNEDAKIGQSFGKAPTPYKIIITNLGDTDGDNLIEVDIKQG